MPPISVRPHTKKSVVEDTVNRTMGVYFGPQDWARGHFTGSLESRPKRRLQHGDSVVALDVRNWRVRTASTARRSFNHYG